MNDKYLSESFEGDLRTKPRVRTAASWAVCLPKGIFILLIALIAYVSGYVCSKTFAEEQAMTGAKSVQTDQTVQEMGMVKTPEDGPRRKKVLVLHTLKVRGVAGE